MALSTEQKSTLAARILQLGKEAKKAYKLRDAGMKRLAKATTVGEIIVVKRKKFRFVNNFENVDVVWGHGSVRKHDLEIVKPAKRGKKAAAKIGPEVVAVV